MLLEERIQKFFRDRRLTLAVAESCTGGAISSRLTKISGASFFFQGGIVAYSNFIKENLLRVSSEILLSKGAVSEETAKQMAEGVLSLFGCDVSLATTGIAGPNGGSENKPVGTVFFAISSKSKKELLWKKRFNGTRKEIIRKASVHALEELLKFVERL